ncbi:DUF1491 family protein [Oceanibacterium hippocampi]|uniref:DUF1491 domain-containing protein n=1 Tax=Oceanibacterium hippocampi TaxID=745714 RepID=A0A1Y5RJ39_9PROT|nr:DUF1491 family protein [Oceanibacterium hippocampi]SLN18503.1 hypothetical protein OCH7691_00398 [Oceanibacterium hippocampi]
MSEVRLRTEIWVKAQIRRWFAAGMMAVVVRHGDDHAGTVLIKLNFQGAGVAVLSQARDLDGNRVWHRATGPEPVAEPEADAYIDRQVGRDPDLWVLELDDAEGRHMLDDPVE